jgi:hypothetical protein
MADSLILDKIIRKCSAIIAAHDDTTLYTDIGHQYRLERYIKKLATEENLTPEEYDFLIAAKWIEGVIQAENPIKVIDFDKSSQFARQRTESLCTELGIDSELTSRLTTFVSNIRPDRTPDNKLDQIFNDATWIDFASPKGRDYLKRYYQQLLLQGYNLERTGWYDTIIGYLGTGEFYTSYAKTNYQKKMEKLVKNLNKEKKELEQRQDLALKQQLDISEKEMKKLKKALTGAKKRDDRAIQTLFRVTLRNHYTLNQMVDRKANIMITVNAIILSLLLGGVIKSEVEQDIVRAIPLILLTLACVVSIFYSVLSIRPNKTQGDFTEEEIRNRQGNLLFFGNFHNMHVRDFEWAFMQMLNDSDYLYGSMIRDYYFLGVTLNKKYKNLRKSLNVFLYGFIVVVVLNLIFRLWLV